MIVVYIYMCVCIYVCMYVSVYVCMSVLTVTLVLLLYAGVDERGVEHPHVVLLQRGVRDHRQTLLDGRLGVGPVVH